MEKVRTAAALGLFDGVHRGHRAVLELAAKQTGKGLLPVVFTFDPEYALSKKSGGGFIYGSEYKNKLLSDLGFRDVYSVSFGDICAMEGVEFAEAVLKQRLNAEVVCCGEDFRFGKGASCGIEELVSFGEKLGFSVIAAGEVSIDGTAVSSGTIRKCLLEGEISKANEFLGRAYAIEREVVHGAHLGNTIGFPTINQLFEPGQLVPKYGVYVSRTYVGDTGYPSVTDIGIKPTVDYGGAPLAETHIIGFSGDLYSRTVRTELVDFIRPEMRFDSVSALRERITEDRDIARSLLEE